jgi:hypothetical protein
MEPRQRAGEIAVIINVRAIIGVGHRRSCPLTAGLNIGTDGKEF